MKIVEFKILSDIVSSQSKGCLLFLQIGTAALVVSGTLFRKRDVALVHAEIDTPHQRLRVGVHPVGSRRSRSFCFGLKDNRPHSGYRDRWLKKLGYV